MGDRTFVKGMIIGVLICGTMIFLSLIWSGSLIETFIMTDDLEAVIRALEFKE